MSEQSEVKAKQGYIPKLKPRACMHCAHYRSTIEKKSLNGCDWTEEKNLRCGIGGFAVKKMGTCETSWTERK